MKESEKLSIGDNLIFEGMTSIRAVLDAIRSCKSDRRIIRVMVAESKQKSRAKELSYLRAMSHQYDFPIEVLPDESFDQLTLGASHGGLLMETTARTIPMLSEDILSGIDEKNRFFVMIEGIEDPYNFGYALRSLYAAGCTAVILSPRNWMSAAGIVCRASAGASELADTFICSSPADCAKIMQNLGVKIVCCDMKDSVSIYNADLKKPLFLAVGGEKRGLSRELLNAADAVVRLDYGREFKNALSAASAAAIAGFEVVRQNLK
ncbi:MAG: RNA methyltransferase [Ruminococcaceae bacterium]|nr:RNA methyltransferase [Oscillospiraceae bacterium]